jgi:hypothetical protein
VSITKLDQRAAELHRRAIVIDGHSDILMCLADRKTRLGERAEVPDWHTWDAPPDAKAMAAMPSMASRRTPITMARWANTTSRVSWKVD